MATITFMDKTYTVDHAVQGPDYVHGYDAEGNVVVSFDGVSDFSTIIYSGTYMEPQECFEEHCNDVKFVDGAFVSADGRHIIRISYGYGEPTGGNPGDIYLQLI